jgi:periplasmic protein CpxP/Spy
MTTYHTPLGRLAARVLAATAAIVIATSAVALAQPGRGGGPGGRGGPGSGPGGPLAGLFGIHVQEHLRGLDLSEAQREQIRTIMQSHREEAQALAQRGAAALRTLNDATMAGGDEGAIRQHSQSLGEVVGDAAILRSRVHGEVWGVLTPEQQAKATAMRADRQQRMEERRQQFEQRRQRGGPPAQ